MLQHSLIKQRTRLTKRDLTPKMFTVLCHLKNGNKLYRHLRFAWIDCGYEAGVANGTFLGLLRRALIIRIKDNYRLTSRGRAWSKLEYVQ